MANLNPIYDTGQMWSELRNPGSWVPFALLDTAEGFIPEQRLLILRRMLEAGLPAQYRVARQPDPVDDRGDGIPLLLVAMLAGLNDEARLFTPSAPAWRIHTGSVTRTNRLFKMPSFDIARARRSSAWHELDFNPTHSVRSQRTLLRCRPSPAVRPHQHHGYQTRRLRRTCIFEYALGSAYSPNMEVIMHYAFNPTQLARQRLPCPRNGTEPTLGQVGGHSHSGGGRRRSAPSGSVTRRSSFSQCAAVTCRRCSSSSNMARQRDTGVCRSFHTQKSSIWASPCRICSIGLHSILITILPAQTCLRLPVRPRLATSRCSGL